MDEDEDTASDTSGGTRKQLDPSVKLGTSTIGSLNGGQPLIMEFEARIATGKAGERLALEQAAAIREVLAWISSNQKPGDETRDQTGP